MRIHSKPHMTENDIKIWEVEQALDGELLLKSLGDMYGGCYWQDKVSESYYWNDESCYLHGPYSTIVEAQHDCEEYCRVVLGHITK